MSKVLAASLIALLALTASSAVAVAQSAPPDASSVTVPVPPPPRPPSDDEVVVPGVQNQQVTPPHGDPRTVSQRMADIRAWDTCVMRAQGQAEGDPMRPQLNSPEDVCRRNLGMSSRTALPDSRRP